MQMFRKSIGRALRPRQISCLRQHSVLQSQQAQAFGRPQQYLGRRWETTTSQDNSTKNVPHIAINSSSVDLTWNGLSGAPTYQPTKLPHRWLRDHCRCSTCVNQDTQQRAYETFSETNRCPTPSSIKANENDLIITWKGNQHVSKYSWEWIINQTSLNKPSVANQETHAEPLLWGDEIAENPPVVQYEEIMAGEEGVGKWTAKIRQYGFCFVDGCPPNPEKTQELLERIAFIRITHYGGFYDFTSDLTMKDTAYTSLALPAHTDTTYFSDPAGLQMFHMLSHTAGEGGASLLVDGFKCAKELFSQDRAAFDTLSKTPIKWHASGNDGVIITPATKRPVFNTELNDGTGLCLDDSTGLNLTQIRWNNDDRGAFPLTGGLDRSPEETSAERWYDAASLWHNIVTRKQNEYWEQLVPGRALIFDNWRVMHGRSVFTGKRRMSGGYINRDDFISRYLNTNFTRERILADIV